MTNKVNIHGLISILLTIDAFGVATFAIVEQSILMAIGYGILVMAFFLIVSIVYCSKCICRENCNHLFIGKLSKILAKPKSGNYKVTDTLFGVITPALPVVIIPQFYLFNNLSYLIIFWLLFAVAFIEVILFVCTRCSNTKCSLCRLRTLQTKT